MIHRLLPCFLIALQIVNDSTNLKSCGKYTFKFSARRDDACKQLQQFVKKDFEYYTPTPFVTRKFCLAPPIPT